jgi:hypothetical protein
MVVIIPMAEVTPITAQVRGTAGKRLATGFSLNARHTPPTILIAAIDPAQFSDNAPG